MTKIKPMKKIILLLSLTFSLGAQHNIAEDFGWMIGQWQGKAISSEPGNKKTEFTQKEMVRWGAGKTILVVDGIGSNSDSGEELFNATGLLYYDAESQSYKLHSFTRDNRSIVADFKITGEKLAEWSFTVPTGKIIYKIDAQDGTWEEKGYFQPKDSDAMYPFFEMNLSKI